MEEFSWKVLKQERPIPWKLLVVIAIFSFSVSAYSIFRVNYFAAALFFIAPVILFITITQGTNEHVCRITDKGIRVNNNFHKYSKIFFFSIVDNFLILKMKEGNAVYIPIKEEDGENIAKALSAYLEEDDYEESMGEVVNRILQIH